MYDRERRRILKPPSPIHPSAKKQKLLTNGGV